MANINDRNSSNREVRRETYQDSNGNSYTTVSRQENVTDPRRVTPAEAPSRTDPNSYRQEVRRETYRDPQGNLHTTTARTTNNAPPVMTPTEASYRNGYISGQTQERRILREEQDIRDNDSAARGLLLGILLTSLVGLTVGSLALLAQRRSEPTPTAPVIQTAPAPAVSPSPSPVPQTAPSTRTTVIERTREVVPVPQQRTIERVVPAPQTAPQTQPSPPSPAPTNSGTDAGTNSGTIVVPDASSTPANSGTSQNGSTTVPQGTSTSPNTTGTGNP